MEFSSKVMEINMKEIGRMVCSMEKELKEKRMAKFLKEFIVKERKKDMENFNGMMEPSMKANGLTIEGKAVELTFGQTAANIRVNGLIPKSKE